MANRKLLMEMDRTSKETTRALQEYDELNKKLSQSLEGNHPTRSEKLFLDLKRDHLGKVIRLRHQIKVWLDGNDSDHIPFEKKQALGELKTLCEARMEEFDKRERLYKTRGFRKDDMEADTKTISWVRSMCDEMRKQKEVVEGELEMRRKDDDLKHRLQSFTYHLFYLELILRGLTNQALDEKEIDELKRDLTDFINGDIDLDEDSDFYEHLDLNSKLESFIDEVTVFSQQPTLSASAAAAAAATGGSEPASLQAQQQQLVQQVQAAPQTAAAVAATGKTKQALKKKQAAAAAVAVPAVEPAPAPAPAASALATPAKSAPPQSLVQAEQQQSANKVVVVAMEDKNKTLLVPPAAPPASAAWQAQNANVVSAPPPLPALLPVATPPRLPSFPPRSSRLSTTPSQVLYTPGGSTRLPSLVRVPIPTLPPHLLAATASSPFLPSPSSLLDSVSDEDFVVFLDQTARADASALPPSTPRPNSGTSSAVMLSPQLQLFKQQYYPDLIQE